MSLYSADMLSVQGDTPAHYQNKGFYLTQNHTAAWNIRSFLVLLVTFVVFENFPPAERPNGKLLAKLLSVATITPSWLRETRRRRIHTSEVDTYHC
jgi:hypothetical protein